MGMGRPKSELILSEAEQAQLTSVGALAVDAGGIGAASPHRTACASGEPNNAVAERFETTQATVASLMAVFKGFTMNCDPASGERSTMSGSPG